MAPPAVASALKTLRQADKGALSGKAGSLFTGKGLGSSGKGKGKLKKASPLIFVLALIFGAAALLFGIQGLLPFHLEANVTEATDPQYAYMLTTEAYAFAKTISTGSVPSSLIARLHQHGITVGYLNDSGDFIAGLPPQNSIATTTSTHNNPTTRDSLVLLFNNEILTSADFIDRINSDAKLYSKFSEATYGRAMNFHDDAANDFYSNIGVSRNVFKQYIASGDHTADTEAFNETMSKIFNKSSDANISVNSTTNVSKTIQKLVRSASDDSCDFKCACDKYGVQKEVNTYVKNGVCYAEPKPDNAKSKDAEAEAFISDVIQRAKRTSKKDANYTTAALVSNALNATETYQSMSYSLAILENISKTKAGDGNEAAIHPVLNWLTTSTEDTITDVSTGKEKTIFGSPIEADPLAAVLSGGTFSASDSADYSTERILTLVDQHQTGGFATASTNHIKSNRAINALKETYISTKPSRSSFVSVFSSFFQGIIEGATETATRDVVALITPSISQSVLFNNASEMTGLNAGHFFMKGVSSANAQLARFASGGTVGDEESIAAYQTLTEKALAMDAAADRLNRSPFDITSKHTFLGSIVASLVPLSIKKSTAKPLQSLSSLTENSLATLGNQVFADGAPRPSFQTTYGDCSGANIIGSKGNVYCTDLITFDVDTVDQLESQEFDNYLAANLDKDGIPIEKKTKHLSTFMINNNGRTSPFGIEDVNILSQSSSQSASQGGLQGTTTGLKKFGETLKNFASKLFHGPNITNYRDSFADGDKNLATGATFVNTKSNSHRQQNNFAQLYISTARVLDQFGYFEEDNENTAVISPHFPHLKDNPVSIFLARHREQNPLDNSDAGYLARISGMSKDDAKFVLAYVYYLDYIAKYQPENCYAFQDFVFKTPLLNQPEEITPKNQLALTHSQTIYSPLRYRSFAS